MPLRYKDAIRIVDQLTSIGIFDTNIIDAINHSHKNGYFNKEDLCSVTIPMSRGSTTMYGLSKIIKDLDIHCYVGTMDANVVLY